MTYACRDHGETHVVSACVTFFPGQNRPNVFERAPQVSCLSRMAMVDVAGDVIRGHRLVE